MIIKKLLLRDWRNAEETRLEFSDSVNLICGDNAAGKTNLLEAIFFFAAGKSFRGCREKELIRFGCDKSAADIEFVSGGAEKRMGVRLKKNERRRFYREGNEIVRMSEFLGEFRSVIFTPDHLDLVKGSPDGRRRFTDMAICQSFPRHIAALSEYNRLLIQKNAHLKGDITVPELLDVYDERMAALAAAITVNRRKYLEQLEKAARTVLDEMSEHTEQLSIMYVTQAEGYTAEEIRQSYLSMFASKRAAEIEKRVTLCGPQKDDFFIYINRRAVRLYGSQGQQRSAVLALKLAEGELSKSLTGEYPVFLLDDVLSELDARRRSYVLGRISGRQVIITGCDPGIAAALGAGTLITVKDGKAECSYI